MVLFKAYIVEGKFRKQSQTAFLRSKHQDSEALVHAHGPDLLENDVI